MINPAHPSYIGRLLSVSYRNFSHRIGVYVGATLPFPNKATIKRGKHPPLHFSTYMTHPSDYL